MCTVAIFSSIVITKFMFLTTSMNLQNGRFFSTNLKVRHPHCVRIIMIEDNSIYIYIYIYSVNTTNHIKAVCKKQLHVSALLPGHHQFVQDYRRLHNRYGLLFGGRDLVLHRRSWGESRISAYICVCICHLRHVHIWHAG